MTLGCLPASFATENAADVYRKAYELLPDLDKPGETLQNQVQTDGFASLSRIEQTTIRMMISANAPAFKLIEQAGEVPKCDWGVDYSQGPSTLYPHLRKTVQAMEWLLIAGEVALYDDQLNESLVHLKTSLTILRHLQPEQPKLIEFLVTERQKARVARMLARTSSKWPPLILKESANLLEPLHVDALKIIKDDYLLLKDSLPNLLQETVNIPIYHDIDRIDYWEKTIDQLVALLSLPEGERDEAINSFSADLHKKHPDYTSLIEGFIGLYSKTINRSRWRNLEFAALRAGLSLIPLDGPLPNEVQDPKTGSKFRCIQQETGFKLESLKTMRVNDREEPVTLLFQ